MIKQLARSSYKVMPWKNGKGTTMEIAKYPPSQPAPDPSASAVATTSYVSSAFDFEWRISSAMVAEDGAFSKFPGFQRSIAVLNDSLHLKVNNSTKESPTAQEEIIEIIINRHSAPFMFPGDVCTTGLLVGGKTVLDFNVFTDRAVCQQHVIREVVTGISNSAAVSPPSNKTHCSHCHITFATNAQLRLHSAHHCFPDNPSEVLTRFPCHSLVIDTVSGRKGVILGSARNTHNIHACVSVRMEPDGSTRGGGGDNVGQVHNTNGLEADVAISRLAVRKHLSLSCAHKESLVFCCFQGLVVVSTATDQVLVKAGDSCMIAEYTGDVEYYCMASDVDAMPINSDSEEGGLDLLIVKIKYL